MQRFKEYFHRRTFHDGPHHFSVRDKRVAELKCEEKMRLTLGSSGERISVDFDFRAGVFPVEIATTDDPRRRTVSPVAWRVRCDHQDVHVWDFLGGIPIDAASMTYFGLDDVERPAKEMDRVSVEHPMQLLWKSDHKRQFFLATDVPMAHYLSVYLGRDLQGNPLQFLVDFGCFSDDATWA